MRYLLFLMVVLASIPVLAQEREGGVDEEKLLELIERTAVEESASRVDFTPWLRAGEDLRRARKIRDGLDQREVSLRFDGVPFSDGIDFVREAVGIDILVDRETLELLESEGRTIHLRVKDLRFRDALELLLASVHEDLAYGIRYGALFIALRSKFSTDVTLEIYDVQDIVGEIPDFPAPRLGIQGFKDADD